MAEQFPSAAAGVAGVDSGVPDVLEAGVITPAGEAAGAGVVGVGDRCGVEAHVGDLVSISCTPPAVVYTTVKVVGAARSSAAPGACHVQGLLSSKITSRVTCTFFVVGLYTR